VKRNYTTAHGAFGRWMRAVASLRVLTKKKITQSGPRSGHSFSLRMRGGLALSWPWHGAPGEARKAGSLPVALPHRRAEGGERSGRWTSLSRRSVVLEGLGKQEPTHAVRQHAPRALSDDRLNMNKPILTISSLVGGARGMEGLLKRSRFTR